MICYAFSSLDANELVRNKVESSFCCSTKQRNKNSAKKKGEEKHFCATILILANLLRETQFSNQNSNSNFSQHICEKERKKSQHICEKTSRLKVKTRFFRRCCKTFAGNKYLPERRRRWSAPQFFRSFPLLPTLASPARPNPSLFFVLQLNTRTENKNKQKKQEQELSGHLCRSARARRKRELRPARPASRASTSSAPPAPVPPWPASHPSDTKHNTNQTPNTTPIRHQTQHPSDQQRNQTPNTTPNNIIRHPTQHATT